MTFHFLFNMLLQNVYEGHQWVKRIKYKSSKNNIFGNLHSPQIITVHSKTILYSQQVAFQSNANHPLAKSKGYIKFEEM